MAAPPLAEGALSLIQHAAWREGAGGWAAARDMLNRVRSGEEEVFPAAVTDRLVNGENPIKVLREHRGLTQAQLAEKANTNKVYISQIERGERRGSLNLLRKLADSLQVDIDDLTD